MSVRLRKFGEAWGIADPSPFCLKVESFRREANIAYDVVPFRRRKIFLDTDVARELTWRLHTELLELPYDDGRRRSDRDALAAEILADGRVAAALDTFEAALVRSREDPVFRERLQEKINTYLQSRTAAPSSSIMSCSRVPARPCSSS